MDPLGPQERQGERTAGSAGRHTSPENKDTRMHIVMVASECAPIAKAGGLGDMVHGLSHELAARGHVVDVVLPKYDVLRYDHIWEMHKAYVGLWVPFHDQWIHCDVHFGLADGLKCYLIEPHSSHNFFTRGRVYGERDDPERFAFFARATLEFLFKAGKQPDILHCHDWQTGLVPVLLYEIYERYGMTHPRVCYTLHNVAHQGLTGEHVLRQVGLEPRALMTSERLLDHSHRGAVNLMKGGIVYSNFVTTVSPRYAQEVRQTELGRGLQKTLETHAAKFGGVLNGVDYGVWNPETDPRIVRHYGAQTLREKYRNKEALRKRFLLRDELRPIVAVVSRLDRQKGAELIEHAVHYSLANDAQFVLLGSATEPALEEAFWRLKRQYNDHPDCHLEIGYDEELAHQIYAGADIKVIPSVFEPCGLTQMIAMRYGVVPVVRNTGGLADTVFDANYSERDFYSRNGYVFGEYTTAALESALKRALGLWHRYPEYFAQLRLNGMRADHSWKQPAQHYLDIYAHIRP
jgi:starch synthase